MKIKMFDNNNKKESKNTFQKNLSIDKFFLFDPICIFVLSFITFCKYLIGFMVDFVFSA